MKKFYNNPKWRRIRGLRGLGILALSVAFCLTGLLALSSCGDNNDEAAAEPIEMRGFFISMNADRVTDCQTEAFALTLEGEVVRNEPNVSVTTMSPGFAGNFPQIGIKVDTSDNNQETIVTAYVSETDGNFDRPGSYFLVATKDSDIPVAEGQTIYTGYWAGYAYRPGGNDTQKPVVACPYVLVPEGSDLVDEIIMEDTDNRCGATDAEVHADLQKYLANDDGSFRNCWVLLDGGVLSPMENDS